MSRKSPALIFFCSLFIAGNLVAEAPPGLEELPEPLPPPEQVETDEELEPEVTIIQRNDTTVAEYRLNGRLYMVKVTPNVGKPYYFVDRDGDGLMESRMGDLYNPTQVPQWLIFSW
jgi:hypothetical protein